MHKVQILRQKKPLTVYFRLMYLPNVTKMLKRKLLDHATLLYLINSLLF